MDISLTLNNLLLILPVILMVYAMVIFCIVKILKEGVANFNKPIWIVIVCVFNLMGAIGYLLIGRRRDL